MSLRVLIVGCGYVGLPLGRELVRRGHTVFGLRRGAPDRLRAAGLTPLTADITQPATLAKLPRDFDWVINCAASGGGSAEDYRQLYLAGNRQLMAWLAGGPIQKFVFTSSTSVYGQTDGSVVTETSPARPAAATARVLVAAENLLLAAGREKFPAVILRVAGIYGPGRGHAFKQFLAGAARLEDGGARFLNQIHRDDVAGAILTALERGIPGEIYNAADHEPVTQRQFFEWLAARLGRPLPPAAAGSHKIHGQRGLTSKRVSSLKLRTELRYKFRYPDFRAGYAAELAAILGINR